MNAVNTEQTTRIAIDAGFGNIKVAWLDETGQIQVRVTPSVVGVAGRAVDMSMLGLGKQRQANRPLTVTFGNNGNGVTYLVGSEVHRYAEPIEDLSHNRLSEGLVARCLAYAALGQAVNGHPARASLMLGFPVEVMKDKDTARAHLQIVRGWLAGPHHFTLDGRPVEITVDQIRAGSQPAGAYFDWGMNEAGEWVRETEALRRPVAVCDTGFNTLDLFAVEGGDIVARWTDGDDLGMHRVARAVQRHLRDHYGVDWGLHQADDLIRQYLANRQPLVHCAAGEVDLSGVIEQALQQALVSINEFIAARWGNGRQFYRLIFAGGGAAALRPRLLRHYPTAIIPNDPVASNVVGLLKRAQRVLK